MLRRNKILLIILATFASLIVFLSFGFQTSNFNDLIQKKFNDQYKKIKLEFKDIRVSLDIKDFAVKLILISRNFIIKAILLIFIKLILALVFFLQLKAIIILNL